MEKIQAGKASPREMTRARLLLEEFGGINKPKAGAVPEASTTPVAPVKEPLTPLNPVTKTVGKLMEKIQEGRASKTEVKRVRSLLEEFGGIKAPEVAPKVPKAPKVAEAPVTPQERSPGLDLGEVRPQRPPVPSRIAPQGTSSKLPLEAQLEASILKIKAQKGQATAQELARLKELTQ
jgi:hypothetical protein